VFATDTNVAKGGYQTTPALRRPIPKLFLFSFGAARGFIPVARATKDKSMAATSQLIHFPAARLALELSNS
jgi:hypothetical protein